MSDMKQLLKILSKLENRGNKTVRVEASEWTGELGSWIDIGMTNIATNKRHTIHFYSEDEKNLSYVELWESDVVIEEINQKKII